MRTGHVPYPARRQPPPQTLRSKTGKLPFDVERVLQRVAKAVEGLPKAALFELYERGYTDPFEQLVACMISVRTLDEVTVPTALALFAKARTPGEMARLGIGGIDRQIRTSTFHEVKAVRLHEIAQKCVKEYGGELPCNRDLLLAMPGIGEKCANLVMGIACGEPHVAVDVHVHRVANRWGFVATSTPEMTTTILEAKVPKRHWVDVNRLLVPFGKHICTGTAPKCSTCPVLAWCKQVGVETAR